MIRRAARPADRAEPVASQPEAEDAGEHRLHREDEGSARRGRAALRPRLDEEAERAREDARHEQGAPDRPAARHLDLAERDGHDREAAEGRQHLRLCEGDRVVAGRVPLHQRDLQRIGGRAGEHEQVADGVAGTDAGQERETGDGEADAEPDGGADSRPEEQQPEERREDDVQPRDEAGARHRRPLEPGRLQRVARGEQEAERDAGDPAAAPERAQPRGGRHRQHEARDREPHREKGEERVDRDGVLHLDEGQPPDRGDEDERAEREHRARLTPRAHDAAPERFRHEAVTQLTQVAC